MTEQAQAHHYDDFTEMREYLDRNFDKLAGELKTIILFNSSEGADPEAHLLLPVKFDAKLWTAMVWDRWTEIGEEQYEKGRAKPGEEITDIMSEHFNGLAEAIADGEFAPEKGSVLPLDTEHSDTFEYYDGLEQLEGWQKLQAVVRSYGLQCMPFLAPVFEDDKFGIGLMVYSGTNQPIRDFLNSGVAGYTFEGPTSLN